MKQRTIRMVLFTTLFLLCGCGGRHAKDTVVERAPGYEARPAWANPDQLWQRDEALVQVTGYAVISGQQRLEAGFRVADSYARAELVEFLSVRVASVLEDVITDKEKTLLSEKIQTESRAVIENLEVTERYWERVDTGKEEALHIYARLDVKKEDLKKLVAGLAEGAEGMETPLSQIMDAVDTRWGDLAKGASRDDLDARIPAGFQIPSWAQGGDGEDEKGFRFVCFGHAETEEKAGALAKAQCNEKLCRLFGVMITARTDINESLDAVDVDREVSERCPSVRISGRELEYQSGECNPKGCVKWMVQTYPRAAHDAERERLDNAVIVEKQVVIREGNQTYRDPAKCEQSLRAFGAIEGKRADAMEKRQRALKAAIRLCNGIDNRDIGVVNNLTGLLVKPTRDFTSSRGDRPVQDHRDYFLFADAAWFEGIETKSSVSERIFEVLTLVEAALDPIRLMDETASSHPNGKRIEAVLERLMKVDISKQPISPHHRMNVYELVGALSQETVPFSETYAAWLRAQLKKRPLKCADTGVGGASVLQYLAKDGLDDGEWRLAMEMTASSPSTFNSCWRVMFKVEMSDAERRERIDQMAERIINGAIPGRFPTAGKLSMFLDGLRLQEQVDAFIKWQGKLSPAEREAVADRVILFLKKLPKKDPEETLRWCEAGAAQIRRVERAIGRGERAAVSGAMCTCEDRALQPIISAFSEDQRLSAAEKKLYLNAVESSPADSSGCLTYIKNWRISDTERRDLSEQVARIIMDSGRATAKQRTANMAALLEQVDADQALDLYMRWHQQLLVEKKDAIAGKLLRDLTWPPETVRETIAFCQKRPAQLRALVQTADDLDTRDLDRFCKCNGNTMTILSRSDCKGSLEPGTWELFELLMRNSTEYHRNCIDNLYGGRSCMKGMSAGERATLVENLLRLIRSGAIRGISQSKLFLHLLRTMSADEVDRFFLDWPHLGDKREQKEMADMAIERLAKNPPGAKGDRTEKQVCETAPARIERVKRRFPSGDLGTSAAKALCQCLHPSRGVSQDATRRIRAILDNSKHVKYWGGCDHFKR